MIRYVSLRLGQSALVLLVVLFAVFMAARLTGDPITQLYPLSALQSMSDADLDQPLDLSGVGLGQHTLGSAIGLLLAHHLGTETGEIAVLKGIQGARGYPM